jgi:hypothetical protein
VEAAHRHREVIRATTHPTQADRVSWVPHDRAAIGPRGEQPLRQLLLDHHLSASRLAPMVGVTNTCVSERWCRGFGGPSPEHLLRLCIVLSVLLEREVTAGDLFTWAGNEETPA